MGEKVTNVTTKFLAEYIQDLDGLLLRHDLTIGEYIQIGLLLKLFEKVQGV